MSIGTVGVNERLYPVTSIGFRKGALHITFSFIYQTADDLDGWLILYGEDGSLIMRGRERLADYVPGQRFSPGDHLVVTWTIDVDNKLVGRKR